MSIEPSGSRSSRSVRAGVSRRNFWKKLARQSSGTILAFDALQCSGASQTASSKLKDIPRLDGTFELEGADLQSFAFDLGRNIQRAPIAVLKPRSVEDLMRMVRYANRHSIKIAMRGRGHSQYGQSLVESGIVVDSSTLRAAKMAGPDAVDVQPGATWGEVNDVTLRVGKTPRVMPDTMRTITVGGVLSVGGWGETSHNFGGVVDTVEELDVITGNGDLLTCSEHQNVELFDMTLAGLGQCGLIVRARLRLMPAPADVVRRELIYQDLDAYLADASRLIVDSPFHYQRTAVNHAPDGGWKLKMMIGMRSDGKGQNLAPLPDGLRFESATEQTRVSYQEYLYRNKARDDEFFPENPKNPLPRAFLTIFLPASKVKDFAAKLLAAPEERAGLIGIFPLNVRRFRRPLFKLPAEDLAFSFWFRPDTAADAGGHLKLMAINRRVIERMRLAGGKRYTPYGLFATAAEWHEHFGPEVWRRFSEAKIKYDPKQVLTPGPGIFI
jgi:cytokinin dehydrogenase